MVAKVVTKARSMVRVRGIIYMPFIQTVLLYGSTMWVVTGEMLKLLEGHHHWSARRIAGIRIVVRRTESGNDP